MFGQDSQNQITSDRLGASISVQPNLRVIPQTVPDLRVPDFDLRLSDPRVPDAPPPPPQISITEAYASAGTQNNGIFHPAKRISQGDVVYQGQQLQFREDFTGPYAKITKVYCAIDNNWAYNEQCSGFEGKSYDWILNVVYYNWKIPQNSEQFGGSEEASLPFVDLPTYYSSRPRIDSFDNTSYSGQSTNSDVGMQESAPEGLAQETTVAPLLTMSNPQTRNQTGAGVGNQT